MGQDGRTQPTGCKSQESAIYTHDWETVITADKRKVKRCRNCLYAYQFGYDLPCPAGSVCPECNGGRVRVYPGTRIGHTEVCRKCHGTGQFSE